jgi:hypothetical protein
MPVDRSEIRRLAADAEVVATIRTIEGIFEFFAQRRSIDPVLAANVTAQEIVEDFWRKLKQGRLRLKDDFDDDDSPFVQEAVTPGQRAFARFIGAKLYAVRQHLRRMARKGLPKSGEHMANSRMSITGQRTGGGTSGL